MHWSRTEERPELDAMLSHCTSTQRPILLVPTNSGAGFHGRFSGFRETIHLTIPQVGLERVLLPRTRCMVSFGEGKRAHAFLSNIRSVRTDMVARTTHVEIESPGELTSLESRLTFRVPVVSNAELEVSVTTRGRQRWQAEAVDVSLMGIQVRFPRNAPSLDVGTPVSVALDARGVSCQLDAEVRRRNLRGRDQRYGMFYPNVVRGSDIDPPHPLRHLIGHLERQWIQARVV
ncbi:MAG: PilZ domain-containing protein [Myxococcales bacterium]|nr:PilZ domain-containing protein [Myxococcales bacterium]